MNYRNILNSITKKEFAQVYFLMGDEPYFIDSITKTAIDTIIPDEHKTLNQAIFYGRDSDVNIILNELKQFPFGFKKINYSKRGSTFKKILST